MSAGSDWIARQLAARGVGQQPAVPGYPNSFGPPQNPYVQQAPPPPQPYNQQPQYGQQGVVTSDDLSTSEGINAMAQRAVAASGDPSRTTICPECNGDSLFTIDRDENNRPLTRPVTRCLKCGWPVMQSGSIHGGAAMAKPSGKAKAARQLQDHTVVIQGANGRQVGQFAPQDGGTGNYV